MPSNRSKKLCLEGLTMTLLQHRSLFQPYLSQRELTAEEDRRIKMREITEKKYLGKKTQKK